MKVSFCLSLIIHLSLIIGCLSTFYVKPKIITNDVLVMDIIPMSDITNVKTTHAQKSTKNATKSSVDDNTNYSPVNTNPIQDIIEPVVASSEKIEEQIISSPEKPIELIEPVEAIIPKIEKKTDIKPEKKSKSEVKKKVNEKIEKKTDIKPEKKSVGKSALKSLAEGKKNNSKSELNSIIDDALEGESDAYYDGSLPLSMSEISAIKGQISNKWHIASFSGGGKQFVATAIIEVNEDGVVTNIKIQKNTFSIKDQQLYQAFIDSIRRAINAASPLQGLNKQKYNIWHEMELTFDSKGMIQ